MMTYLYGASHFPKFIISSDPIRVIPQDLFIIIIIHTVRMRNVRFRKAIQHFQGMLRNLHRWEFNSELQIPNSMLILLFQAT